MSNITGTEIVAALPDLPTDDIVRIIEALGRVYAAIKDTTVEEQGK